MVLKLCIISGITSFGMQRDRKEGIQQSLKIMILMGSQFVLMCSKRNCLFPHWFVNSNGNCDFYCLSGGHFFLSVQEAHRQGCYIWVPKLWLIACLNNNKILLTTCSFVIHCNSTSNVDFKQTLLGYLCLHGKARALTVMIVIQLTVFHTTLLLDMLLIL